jgi:hypothetical protein
MEKINHPRLEDLKEKLLTIGVFTGIFLPARLLFYNYISDYWLGSFGLITGILLTMMYLAKKNKLGYLGKIVNRQILSFAKGKYGIFAIIILIFYIYLFSLYIYGINNFNPELKDNILTALAAEGYEDLDSIAENVDKLTWIGPGTQLVPLFSLVIIFIPNNLGYVVYSIMNDYTDGWMLHFVTVFLVEELEALGLVIYFRYVHR